VPDPAEVVRVDQVGGLPVGPAGHGRGEDLLVRRGRVQVVEEPAAVHPLERGVPAADRRRQAGRGVEVELATDERQLAHGPGYVRAQPGAGRGEPEPAVRQLVQHLVGGEPAQHPGQRPDRHPHRRGQVVRAARPRGQLVGDAEPGGEEEQLRAEVTVHQPAEPKRAGRLARDPRHPGR